MNKRTFFLTSIVLAFVALVLHSIAREKIMHGSHLKAVRLQAVGNDQTNFSTDTEAERLFRNGRTLNRIGFASTIKSAACVFVAIARRETGPYSVPLLLLVLDLGTQMHL